MHSLSAPSRWLASELATLLSTPQQGNLPEVAPTQVGEVDHFTSRFDNVFLRHARGLVSGKEVDREELKQTLLILQKRWNASNVRYVNCELHYRIDGFHVSHLPTIPWWIGPRFSGDSVWSVVDAEMVYCSPRWESRWSLRARMCHIPLYGKPGSSLPMFFRHLRRWQ